MTFKQTIRRFLADLWCRCAKLAEDKISTFGCKIDDVAEWEAFIIRCEQRAIRHAEYVPAETDQPK